ncbi:MAG: hypothetical protein AAFQ37_07905, partial [Bacteroidota bacterium]
MQTVLLKVGHRHRPISGILSLLYALALFFLGMGQANAQSCNADGGELALPGGGTIQVICADDGISDAFTPTLTNQSGDNFAWIITNSFGLILARPDGPPFDLEGAGDGACFIYHFAYNDGFTGDIEVGDNVCNLMPSDGCFDLSNHLTISRRTGDDCAMDCDADGGMISLTDGTDELMICAGDGISDAFDVNLTGNIVGANTAWVITDLDGMILGLPASPPFDLDGAGPGVCLVWHLAFENGLTGLEVGFNADDLEGCFDFSNRITVVRLQPEAGELTGGPFEFTAGDGIADMIPEGAITVGESQGENFQWIITDDAGNILGLPPTFSVVDFDGASAGTCRVWYLRFDEEVTGLAPGLNIDDLEGCFDISNPIDVIRTVEGDCQANGGELFGGPFEFTAGDGVADMIPEGAITVANSQGENFQWIVTDDAGNILGLPPMPSAVNFDGAGAGTCQVWYLRFDGEVTGLMAGANIADIEGCHSLSANAVQVIRTVEGDCQANGGELF